MGSGLLSGVQEMRGGEDAEPRMGSSTSIRCLRHWLPGFRGYPLLIVTLQNSLIRSLEVRFEDLECSSLVAGTHGL